MVDVYAPKYSNPKNFRSNKLTKQQKSDIEKMVSSGTGDRLQRDILQAQKQSNEITSVESKMLSKIGKLQDA